MSVKRHECEEKIAGGNDESTITRGNLVWFLETDGIHGALIIITFCPFCGVKLE